MGKPTKDPGPSVPIAGFTPEQWKDHMDVDEDWTERLEGATEAEVLEAIAALDHADAGVRALACNLVYAIGVAGLGAHASRTVARLGELAQGSGPAKVKNRARVIHEGLAGELERIAIRREMPWLSGYSEDALAQATTALEDPREAVRLQVYLWWANATAVPAKVRAEVAETIAARAQQETDEVTRRTAELAHAHLRGG